MGGGASALPEHLSEERLKQITSGNFKVNIYETLKDPDGSVPKTLFINCFEKGPENEVFQLFLVYCPSGKMKKDDFLSLCRVNKLLNKHVNSAMATEAFQNALRPAPRDGDGTPRLEDTIGYNQFRQLLVPSFAKLKELNETDLIERLSRCEFPSYVVRAGSTLPVAPNTTSTPIVPVPTEGTPSPEAAKVVAPIEEPNNHEETTSSKLRRMEVGANVLAAMIRLQALLRAKIAKRRVADLKEIRDIKAGKTRSRRPTAESVSCNHQSTEKDRIKDLVAEQNALKKEIKQLLNGGIEEENGDITSFEDSEKPPPTAAEIAESDLSDLFEFYCNPPKEMDVNMFKKFLRETYTVTKKFTLNDADAIFKKTVAKASAAPASSPLKTGVFFDKRINFYVFYHVAIPLITKARGGITHHQLVDFLNNANVAVRSRETRKKQQVVAQRHPSKDHGVQTHLRRPSYDVQPATIATKHGADSSDNPFGRQRPSFDNGPRKSFDNTPRKSFDKPPTGK